MRYYNFEIEIEMKMLKMLIRNIFISNFKKKYILILILL